MEKEIYWSKDVSVQQEPPKPVIRPSPQRASSSQQQSAPGSHPNAASNLRPRHSPLGRGAFKPLPGSDGPVSSHGCGDRKKELSSVLGTTSSNCDVTGNSCATTSGGASFKNLRNEDKLKLASLIQELATLSEEHQRLKDSLYERTRQQELEKEAFEREKRQFLQERESLVEVKSHLELSLNKTQSELEKLRLQEKEITRNSVSLQTTPTKDKQQSNAPSLNTSLDSSSSNPRRKRSESREKTAAARVTTATGVQVDPGEFQRREEPSSEKRSPREPVVDVGLVAMDVLSKTDDKHSVGGSTYNISEPTVARIEQETLALKRKISEQEKLLELKRKQIQLQHELHDQEVTAFKMGKAASDDNVKAWIQHLPAVESHSDPHNTSQPRVTFEDDAIVAGHQLENMVDKQKSLAHRSKSDCAEKSSAVRRPSARKGHESCSESSEEHIPIVDRSRRRKPRKAARATRVPEGDDARRDPIGDQFENDDLLLEAAGKLMSCRQMLDRSDGRLDNAQYTQYMETMERKKLEKQLPEDTPYERKMRCFIATERGRQLLEAMRIEHSDNPTKFLPSFFKLVDHMEDRTVSPAKYQNHMNSLYRFAREVSCSPSRKPGRNRKASKSPYGRQSKSPTRKPATRSPRRLEFTHVDIEQPFTISTAAPEESETWRRRRYHQPTQASSARSSGSSATHKVIHNSTRGRKSSSKHDSSAVSSHLEAEESQLFEDVFFIK